MSVPTAAAVRGTACGLLLLAAAGCAPAGAPQATPTHLLQLREWNFHAAEHVAFWYHALAHAGTSAAETQNVLPLYDAAYVSAAASLRGAGANPFATRAAEFAAPFRAGVAYRSLEFLPLYFENSDALFGAFRVWDQVAGDPRRASDQQTAAAVALLSGLFPQPAQRQTLGRWRALLEEERRDFYAGHWSSIAADLQRVAAAAAAEWAPLAGPMRPLLSYAGLQGGDVYLVPALGPEGRLLPTGAGRPRVAIHVPGLRGEAGGPPGVPVARQVVYSFIHELLYPLASEAVREHLAPAKAREIGAELIELNTAVRGGALALERFAPEQARDYRRYYLHGAGLALPDDAAALNAAFTHAFPLPPELEAGLAREIERALAGI